MRDIWNRMFNMVLFNFCTSCCELKGKNTNLIKLGAKKVYLQAGK